MSLSLKKRYRISFLFCISLIVLSLKIVCANENSDNPILIISSYNPETAQTAKNISEFLDEYKLLGGTSSVIIENMNCKSFSEAFAWKSKMRDILVKYQGNKSPRIIILLGQEAWTSYISQDSISNLSTPLICGMISRNAVILPSAADSVSLENWEPESIDASDLHVNVTGFAYDYDIEKNIRLLLDFYPDTKHIAFISDNSYGGVTLQAYVKKEMAKFPSLDLIMLDGRKQTIYTIVDKISALPEKTVILMGTWRVDKNEGYFMRNATYSMMSANPSVPAFTLSSLGLGHWVLGGYIPEYRSIGKDLARQVVAITNGDSANVFNKLQFIPSVYNFDYEKLQELGFGAKKLPEGSILVNKNPTFFEVYKYPILGVLTAFIILFLGFVTTLYYYLKTKKLKDELQESEIELFAAKERAEESDRLKSAFLANMSHEIRTPLNAIVGFSNVLVNGTYTPEEQKEFVDVIQTNSDLLLRLINDILDISRLETGKLKLSLEECDLVGLCQNVMATTSYGKKNEVTYVFKPAIESFELKTDIQRLRQILINLLSNANKFTLAGTITLDFTIDRANGYIIFYVTDTGCGIPKDKRNKVFERFEKLDEYKQGTGLGLSICKIIVELLGGKIWVDQDYEEGARFIFTHPIRH